MEAPGFNRNFAAARSYVPGPLDAKVVQFLAAHEPHSTQVLDDPRFGWRESVTGEEGVTFVDVPATATALFKPPYAAELAERFQRVVAQTSAHKNRKSRDRAFHAGVGS